MDIDTHVDGQHWWLVVHPDTDLPLFAARRPSFVVTEEEFYALRDIYPPRRCEVEVPGSHRGQTCPNYCEPGEYTCRAHPLLGDDHW